MDVVSRGVSGLERAVAAMLQPDRMADLPRAARRGRRPLARAADRPGAVLVSVPGAYGARAVVAVDRRVPARQLGAARAWPRSGGRRAGGHGMPVQAFSWTGSDLFAAAPALVG